MKETFLYVYLLLKVIHNKVPAIPSFVDKINLYNKAIFSQTLIVKKKILCKCEGYYRSTTVLK